MMPPLAGWGLEGIHIQQQNLFEPPFLRQNAIVCPFLLFLFEWVPITNENDKRFRNPL